MADSDKNILITPNIGQTTEPIIEFTGADNNTVTLRVLDDGTISIEGSVGQLFSVADSMSGTIFSVNDISGIPSIEVIDDGTVIIAEYTGNVGIGTSIPSYKLDVNGDVNITGDITITGTVDGVDISDFKTSYDSHDHDDLYYTETEINTKLTDGTVTKFTTTSNDTFTGTYPLIWYTSNTPYTASWLTVNGTTDTLNAPNIYSTGTINAVTDLQLNGTTVSVEGHTHSYDNYGSWTIKDGDTTTYTITSGDTLTIASGTGISVNFTADDVLTITNTAPDTTYTHPSHPGDDFSVDTGALTGAVVVSDIDINVTTDTLGHVTDANGVVSTRTLTPADIGAATSSHTHSYSNVSVANQANSRIITATGTTDALDSEANLTFNGSLLYINGDVTSTGTIEGDFVHITTSDSSTETDLILEANAVISTGTSITFGATSASSFWRWMTEVTSNTGGTAGGTEIARLAYNQLSLYYDTEYPLNINGANDGKIVLQGSSDPYIRFREGSTDKGYIQWNSDGFLRLVNQESGAILRVKDDLDFSWDNGGNYYSIINSSGGTFVGPVVIDQNGRSGNIVYNISAGCYIPMPLGGQFKAGSASYTGAIAVKLPTASFNQNDMISFWVDIYDYAGDTTGESVSVYVYGYQAGTTTWNNTGAIILSDRADRDYNVRFGLDGTRHIVYIGETSSTWSYPQITVRDFQAGYSASYANYDEAFAVTFETSFATVIKTSTSNYPTAGTLDGISASSFVRSDVADTVAGVLTFSSFPVTPSSAPTTDYQVANKKYVDDNAGGGTAADITITDTNNYYTSNNVEGALQELGNAVDATAFLNKYNYTASSGQTTFTAVYDSGDVDVYVNGIRLEPSTDYSLGTDQVIMASGLEADDNVQIDAYTSIANFKYDHTETVYNLTGTIIDPNNGTIQYKILSGNTTFTENFSSGQSVTLRLTNGSSYTVTWPTITWFSGLGDIEPTLTGNDLVVIWKENTTLYGTYIGSAD